MRIARCKRRNDCVIKFTLEICERVCVCVCMDYTRLNDVDEPFRGCEKQQHLHCLYWLLSTGVRFCAICITKCWNNEPSACVVPSSEMPSTAPSGTQLPAVFFLITCLLKVEVVPAKKHRGIRVAVISFTLKGNSASFFFQPPPNQTSVSPQNRNQKICLLFIYSFPIKERNNKILG